MSPAAPRKSLQTRIDAAQKLAEVAKKEAKLAKLNFRNAKQLFKGARRSAKKLRKEVKVLKGELAALAVRQSRRPAAANPVAPKPTKAPPKPSPKRARRSALPASGMTSTPVETRVAPGELPAASLDILPQVSTD